MRKPSVAEMIDAAIMIGVIGGIVGLLGLLVVMVASGGINGP